MLRPYLHARMRPAAGCRRSRRPATRRPVGRRRIFSYRKLMGQDIFDVIIVLVLTAFAARGFWTGFVGEVAGLISIVGAWYVFL